MHINNLRLLIVAVLIVVLAPSCVDDDGGSSNACNSDFDQPRMLAKYADELIIPSYGELVSSVSQLKTAADQFLASPNTATLAELKSSIQSGYTDYVTKEMLQFGPAEDADLRNIMNPFPVNTNLVENLLTNNSEDYVFSFDRGYPALEYIFFADRSNEAIIELFDDAEADSVARTYLNTIVAQMYDATLAVNSSWNNGYRASFVANTGSAAGTSVSLIINALNEHWERTKRDRLGIPAGVTTLGITNPATVESRFLGQSLELLKLSISANKTMFNTGLNDYLDAINANKNGQPLTSLINDQYTAATAAVNVLSGSLAVAVDEMPAEVTTAYTKLVENIVLLKTDMPSVLCVAITYVDNPSDSD